MTIQVIPTTPGVPFYAQRTKLDGADYLLRFTWNQREERWYLSLYDESEQPIAQSLKLICNWPLLRHYQSDPRCPRGEIIAFDLTGENTPPGLDELGIGLRVELTYFPAADVAAMFAQ